MNQFLTKQNVDVSRSLALVMFIVTAESILSNLNLMVFGGQRWDLSFIPSLPLALGLWNYKSIARKWLIGLVWVMIVLVFGLMVGAQIAGKENALTVQDVEVLNPTVFQVGYMFSLWIVVSAFLLLLVHSNKFKEETQPIAGGDAPR
ncbi:MAG: hypothetical protein AB3N64_04985 [Puniceicoccaceae bacterium]